MCRRQLLLEQLVFQSHTKRSENRRFFFNNNSWRLRIIGHNPNTQGNNVERKRSQSFKELVTYLSYRYKSDIYGLQGELHEWVLTQFWLNHKFGSKLELMVKWGLNGIKETQVLNVHYSIRQDVSWLLLESAKIVWNLQIIKLVQMSKFNHCNIV